MAIFGNYTAEMLVNDEALQEYEQNEEIEIKNPDTVVKYVQATSGAKFTINVSVCNMSGRMADCVTFSVYTDGTFIDSWILRKKDPGHGLWQTKYAMEGVKDVSSEGDWTLRSLMFSEIKAGQFKELQMIDPSHVATVEAPAGPDFKSTALANLGTVTINIRRGKFGKRIDQPKAQRYTELGNMTEVPEKELKELKGLPLTHVSMLGQPMKCKPRVTWDMKYIDPKDSPHARFIFKYCSKKTLQNMLLIPRSPSPVPLEERPVEELSLEQLQEIVRQQQARAKISNLKGIKSENGAKTDSIKRERSPETEEILNSAQVKKVKVHQRIANGEIVEPSDDD